MDRLLELAEWLYEHGQGKAALELYSNANIGRITPNIYYKIGVALKAGGAEYGTVKHTLDTIKAYL